MTILTTSLSNWLLGSRSVERLLSGLLDALGDNASIMQRADLAARESKQIVEYLIGMGSQ